MVPGVTVRPTLARGKVRIPYKLLGKMRALALHDHIVARRLPGLVGKIDVIHAYAAGSLQTLRMARKLGIPTVLERTDAHTAFAFEAVGKEFERLGVVLPPTDEYYYRADLLAKEEAEYEAADYLLCPSDFVVKTFVDRGFPRKKLLRFINGVSDKIFYPASEPPDPGRQFTMLFVGVCAVRKGVHFALEAWLKSPGFPERQIPDCGRRAARVRGQTVRHAGSSERECFRARGRCPGLNAGFGRFGASQHRGGFWPGGHRGHGQRMCAARVGSLYRFLPPHGDWVAARRGGGCDRASAAHHYAVRRSRAVGAAAVGGLAPGSGNDVGCGRARPREGLSACDR